MPSLVEFDSIKVAKKLKRSENLTKLQRYCNISDELKPKKYEDSGRRKLLKKKFKFIDLVKLCHLISESVRLNIRIYSLQVECQFNRCWNRCLTAKVWDYLRIQIARLNFSVSICIGRPFEIYSKNLWFADVKSITRHRFLIIIH